MIRKMEYCNNENDKRVPNVEEGLQLPSSTSLARRRNSPNLTLYIKKNASPKASVSKKIRFILADLTAILLHQCNR